MKPSKLQYEKLLADIGSTIERARENAVRVINTELVKANFEIGRHIVEYEQHGEERAEYGSDLLTRLSRDLRQRYGKGFGRRNVLDMRRFYLTYQKWQTVSAELITLIENTTQQNSTTLLPYGYEGLGIS